MGCGVSQNLKANYNHNQVAPSHGQGQDHLNYLSNRKNLHENKMETIRQVPQSENGREKTVKFPQGIEDNAKKEVKLGQKQQNGQKAVQKKNQYRGSMLTQQEKKLILIKKTQSNILGDQPFSKNGDDRGTLRPNLQDEKVRKVVKHKYQQNKFDYIFDEYEELSKKKIEDKKQNRNGNTKIQKKIKTEKTQKKMAPLQTIFLESSLLKKDSIETTKSSKVIKVQPEQLKSSKKLMQSKSMYQVNPPKEVVKNHKNRMNVIEEKINRLKPEENKQKIGHAHLQYDHQ